ncbi:uncharacterized protein LOC133260633 [Bos javanicus]|uniref:uncharacterized protein LOC133260633 n=1 Tax=Bos javanicus TaxID=9906 RepID=UPI002AA6BF4A|nr:uncharacterized protein LOC133260633 [Bos javanicus]
MVSVCLPFDALLQHLLSYLGFSYLGRGVSLHGCSSKAQLLLLTLYEGYLLTSALPDLQRGMAPLGPPVPAQPPLLGCGVAPPGRCPWPRAWGRGAPLGHRPWPQKWGSSSQPPPLTSDLGSSSQPFLRGHSLALSVAAPDLGRGVTPLGRYPSDMGSSGILPLTSDMGVAPPGHHPWPRVWGSSSQPPPLTSDLGRSSQPFLRRRSVAAWHSRSLPLTSDVG